MMDEVGLTVGSMVALDKEAELGYRTLGYHGAVWFNRQLIWMGTEIHQDEYWATDEAEEKVVQILRDLFNRKEG